eukprot:CAMPEP_0177694834 /NCGR_PEP_ID=MMETSP0484_2-20121128/3140_1 /TAXON_ID=354590 /ORGANISM="Rhodomonas lens, Strain RHODO" /LENGTH=277 /DNA_ID=CAMNT_0019205729 /DNA_START=24 /DNA_END=853 /DNA_ORIENTATION=+
MDSSGEQGKGGDDGKLAEGVSEGGEAGDGGINVDPGDKELLESLLQEPLTPLSPNEEDKAVSRSEQQVDAAGVDDGSAADFSAPKNNSNAERLSALKESVVTGASHTWGAVRSAASALPSNLNIKWRNENAPLDVDGEVELPVGMISWQLLLSVGWGPYLCLPVESGHYASRNQLASMLQRLLQSTVRDDEGITWVVSVDKEDGKVVFALQQGEGLGGKKSTGSVSGFRIAPSADLCAILRVTLGTDGWLSSHLSKDGTITTHPLSLSLPPSLPPSL